MGEAGQPYRAEQIWIYDCDMQAHFSGPGGTVGPLSASFFSPFFSLRSCYFLRFSISSEITSASL